MSQDTLTRRAFLVTAGLGVFFFDSVCLAAELENPPLAVPSGGSRLAGVLRRKCGAWAVGSEYLRHSPEEADPFFLVDAICGSDRELRRILSRGDDDRLRTAIRSHSHRDFADGRTVLVDGWLLSRTEARLCALATIA